MRLFGIETEYGIARQDRDEIDPVVESMELVRAYLMAPFERRWDYGGEDPHEDARGFRVSGLALARYHRAAHAAHHGGAARYLRSPPPAPFSTPDPPEWPDP